MFDWLIQNAHVVDGERGEFQADVALSGERIAAVLPPHSGAQAAHEVDATGLWLMPGIVDIHRHADLAPFAQGPGCELAQGITTMVSGNCGFSPAPNAPQTFDAMRAYAMPILGEIPEAVRGMSTAAFYEAVEKRPLFVNCGYLAGNGDLRRSVAGFSDAPLSAKQMDRICGLLDEAFDAGALGLSMGIMYTPECYYSTAELATVAKVAARRGRPVIAHIRGEGGSVLSSVEEMLQIGRASGARIHISHMKAAGTDMWGWAVDQMLERIRRAQREGLDVTFDAYPYTAGSTTLLSLFPPEMLAEGTQGVLRLIADAQGRKRVLKAFETARSGWDNFIITLGWGRVTVAGSSQASEVGRTIEALAEQAGCTPGEYALDMLLREDGCVPVVLEEMAQEDVDKILCQPDCLVISDSLYSASGRPHPRKHGAFQRFLCRYVKEKGLLSPAQAVGKMTCLPAQFMGLKERGSVKEGYFADLVLMDWERLKDRATYLEPERESEGIETVFVNGSPAWQKGAASRAHAGKLLRGDRT